MPGGRVVLAGCMAAALTACTAAPAAFSTGMAEAAKEMFPSCRAEIQGYVDLARLATTYGRDWDVFQDALGDMKAQVLDCADGTPETAVQAIRHSRPGVKKQGERLPPPSLSPLFPTSM